MTRLYEAAAYAPQTGIWWDETEAAPDWPRCDGDTQADVAIIGGGFTGLTAALHLAQDGVDVALFEAAAPGFGASTRNGGFCCLGGARLSRRAMLRRFGPQARADWCATEKAAVDTVARLLADNRIDADTHSRGETMLAHNPRAMADLRASVPGIEAEYGVTPTLTEARDLPGQGLNGPFHGALTIPLGFALNPRRYHGGLARAAASAGARLYAQSPVTKIENGFRLTTPNGQIAAKKLIVATNGYGSDDLPGWLRSRYIPVQSSVIVTRPLTIAEQAAQGWTSDQMCYDTRTLLHYFRKLPDDRFLFGMRGGLSATPRAEAAIRSKIRADFNAMFPAWLNVEITHDWSGLVCLMGNLTPFAGPIPGMPGAFAGLGYHGNGVAMASHTGVILADLAMGKPPRVGHPQVMQAIPRRFPLGRYRRALLRPAYALAQIMDR